MPLEPTGVCVNHSEQFTVSGQYLYSLSVISHINAEHRKKRKGYCEHVSCASLLLLCLSLMKSDQDAIHIIEAIKET